MQLRPFVGKWNEESCLAFWQEIGKRFVPATAFGYHAETLTIDFLRGNTVKGNYWVKPLG